MSDTLRETLGSIAGFAFLAWTFLILFGVIPRWLWKPLRVRQSNRRIQNRAVSYTLVDIAVLIVYVGIAFAAAAAVRKEPSSSEFSATLLAVSLSLLTLALWFIGLRVLRRADIRDPKRRIAFQFVVLPAATLGAFTVGLGTLFLVIEAVAHRPPQMPEIFIAMTAISFPAIAACRPISSWIASEPPQHGHE